MFDYFHIVRCRFAFIDVNKLKTGILKLLYHNINNWFAIVSFLKKPVDLNTKI